MFDKNIFLYFEEIDLCKRLRVNNYKIYVNTTGSKYNMNPSPNRINIPYEILNLNSKSSIEVKNANLCGYTCIESDVIHDNFNGNISIGDMIIFKEVGSYSIVMKPPFILPDVPIIEFDDEEETVTIEEDGTGDLITGYQEDMFLE